MSRFLKMAAAALLATTSPLAAQTVAITGGTVVLGDGGEPIPNGTVIVQGGRVVAAGAGVAVPAGAERVDATGKWVTPGLVSGFTRLGLAEVDAVSSTNDAVARSSPFSAAIDVAPAINPRAEAIGVTRAGGVTRAIVAPVTARSIFAGQGAVIDTAADMNPITRRRAFQYVEFGEEGANDAGGSRPAAHAYFRNALREAREVAAGQTVRSVSAGAAGPDGKLPVEDLPDTSLLTSVEGRPNDVLLSRYDARALVPVIQGRQRLLVHVDRASDILEMLDLKREFPQLRLVLVGAAEGWTVAREIAASGVPVIANALTDLPAAFEQLAATQSNVGRMAAAGVEVGIGMLNEDETRMVRVTPQLAGNLVALTRVPGASGLSWGQAFAAVSSKPADIMGLGGEIGSLAPGRRADVVLWSGDPLELSSAAERVWIDGVEQSLVTRQTRLRDRYATPAPGDRPKAYDR